MGFAGLNPLAIGVAAVAALLWGALYYRLLGAAWRRAGRRDPLATTVTPGTFITTLVAELAMAWVLAGSIGHLGVGQVTLRNGVISALFIWAGFVASSTAVNQRRLGFGWTLTLLDAGHWLGALLVMGAVIGEMGV